MPHAAHPKRPFLYRGWQITVYGYPEMPELGVDVGSLLRLIPMLQGFPDPTVEFFSLREHSELKFLKLGVLRAQAEDCTLPYHHFNRLKANTPGTAVSVQSASVMDRN